MAKKKDRVKPLKKPSLEEGLEARWSSAKYHADKANRVLTGRDHAKPDQIARAHAHAMTSLALMAVILVEQGET